MPIQPDLVRQGYTEETYARHKSALEMFVQWFEDNPLLRDYQLGQATAALFAHYKQKKAWCWATTFRNMSSLMGALSNLTMYVLSINGKAVGSGFQLNNDEMWKLAMKRAEKGKNSEEARRPVSMTSGDAAALLLRDTSDNPEERQLQTLLLLAWYSAGRVGDVLQLREHHVKQDPAVAAAFKKNPPKPSKP